MTNTTTISAEGRKRVAEACEPMPTECAWYSDGEEVWSGVPYRVHVRWNPGEKYHQWQALTRKVAQLIREEISRSSGHKLFEQVNTRLVQFNAAIATNDVNAIEALVLELLEGKA